MHVLRTQGLGNSGKREATPGAYFPRPSRLSRRRAGRDTRSPRLSPPAPRWLTEPPPAPAGALYPVKRNDTYKLDRPLTPENLVTTYNNYYEFGSSKHIRSGSGSTDPALDSDHRRYGG